MSSDPRDLAARQAALSPEKRALLAKRLRDAGSVSATPPAAAAPEPIAIVGLGCRFPGAHGPDEFWTLVRDGLDAITEVPSDRWDLARLYDPDGAVAGKVSTRWGGFLDGIDRFDAAFFGISPREAIRMDPQQRLLLEVAWEALEHAGQTRASLAGSATGVFVGVHSHSTDYASLQFADPRQVDGFTGTGTAHNFLSGRLSYLLDLHGPSLSLDTACSSSLVAVHLACQSLRAGECRLALAGGVNLMVTPDFTIAASRMQMLSPDGRCFAFDARANGFVRGEGCGVVVLRRLAEARAAGDRVIAVIRGDAVNQDGRTNGITAPNGRAQEAVIREALRMAQVDPRQIGYIEAHGTGTTLGDPIEVEALGAVYGAASASAVSCALGSTKANVGHLEGAAGIAGLIKATLVLQHRQIPPVANFQTRNPHLTIDGTRLEIPTAARDWHQPSGARFAAVSSFGWSGTNAHVVLEEAPADIAADRGPSQSVVPTSASMNAAATPAPAPAPGAASPARLRASRTQLEPFVLSAASAPALDALIDRTAAWIEARTSTASTPWDASASTPADDERVAAWHDVVWSAAQRRTPLDHRLLIAARSESDLLARLRAARGGAVGDAPSDAAADVDPLIVSGRVEAERPGVAFVFPGQGSQWIGMGRDLLAHEPVARAALEQCDAAIHRWAGWSVIAELTADASASRLSQIDVIQPSLFAIQVALAALWRAWGIEPDIVVGHSMGEIAAAHVAGMLTLDDAARIICRRSALLKRASGRGAMGLIELSIDDVRAEIRGEEDRLSIAVSNGRRATVVAGDPDRVQALMARLTTREIFCKAINVDVASHSPQMDALRDDLIAAIDGIAPGPGRLPMHSTVLNRIVDGASLTPDYWARNLREPVLFGAAVERLASQGTWTFVEISPHPVLTQAIETTLREDVGGPEIDRDGADGSHAGLVAPSMRRDEEARAVLLPSLGRLFAAGAVPAWNAIVQPGRFVAGPTYPWQHERFWFDGRTTRPADAGGVPAAAGARSTHPLLSDAIDAAEAQRDAGDVIETGRVEDALYEVAWPERPVDRERTIQPPVRRETWIVVGGGGLGEALTRWLEGKGQTVARVEDGDSWRRPDGDGSGGNASGGRFVADLAARKDAEQTLDATVGRDARSCAGVVWLTAIDGPSALAGGRSAHAAALWLQVIDRLAWTRSPRLWLVTRGAQPVDGRAAAPEQAALWGVGRLIGEVYDDLYGGLIDLDPSSAASIASDLDALSQALWQGDDEPEVAWRGGRRHVARLTRAAEAVGTQTTFRADAAYVITGAFGGVGSRVAHWMVERGARRLVLIGRTPLPPRTAWMSLPADGDLARRVATVRALEAAGASVHVLGADAADESAVAMFFDTWRHEAWPSIRGVVHAAMVFETAPERQLDPETWAASLRAKAGSAAVLDRVLTENLDFFVSFSSIASLLPQPGLGAYAAANAVLDSFASAQRGRGRAAIAINWGVWRGLGQAVSGARAGAEAYVSQGIGDFDPELGLDALGRAIGGTASQLVVAPFDWPRYATARGAAGSRLLVDLLADAAARAASSGTSSSGAASFVDRVRAAAAEERRTLIERHVQALAARVLRLPADQIELTRPLGTLGLESLMALELRRRLEAATGLRLPTTLAWNHPTIRAIATFLATRLDLSLDDRASASSGSAGPARSTPAMNATSEHDDRSHDDTTTAADGALVEDLSEDEALRALMGGDGREA